MPQVKRSRDDILGGNLHACSSWTARSTRCQSPPIGVPAPRYGDRKTRALHVGGAASCRRRIRLGSRRTAAAHARGSTHSPLTWTSRTRARMLPRLWPRRQSVGCGNTRPQVESLCAGSRRSARRSVRSCPGPLPLRDIHSPRPTWCKRSIQRRHAYSLRYFMPPAQAIHRRPVRAMSAVDGRGGECDGHCSVGHHFAAASLPRQSGSPTDANRRRTRACMTRRGCRKSELQVSAVWLDQVRDNTCSPLQIFTQDQPQNLSNADI